MQSSEKLILIAEDDPKTASLVAIYLEKEGFQTIIAGDGQKAIHIARQHRLSFVILDLMIPKVDGWEVCRSIRRFSDVPILMLTAREDETDRISGLTMGADDYVVKPFSPRELTARVRAILRRGRMKSYREESLLSAGEIVMDTEKHQVRKNGRTVQLTPHEFKLLKALMQAGGRVLNRDQLLLSLYPEDDAFVVDRVVDVHIGKLRQKIEKNPSKPKYILTVRGVGYCFAEGGDK